MGPSNFQGVVFGDKLVDGADAVGGAEPDGVSLSPGLKVLVDVARQADDASLVGGLEGVALSVASRAEALGGGDVLGVGGGEEGGESSHGAPDVSGPVNFQGQEDQGQHRAAEDDEPNSPGTRLLVGRRHAFTLR